MIIMPLHLGFHQQTCIPVNEGGFPFMDPTDSVHHGKDPSTDDKGIPRTSEIGINCKPYKINMKRHGKYSFIQTTDDKLPQVEKPKDRRDSLDSCCQTPSDWKELTNDDIDNVLQEPSTEKATENSRKINSTSLTGSGRTRPIG